jgi:hypothetical protein
MKQLCLSSRSMLGFVFVLVFVAEACRRRKRARPSSILANRYSPDQYLLKPI